MVKLNAEDKVEINEIVNKTQETAIVLKKESGVALESQFKGVAIEGLQDVPVSVIPVPFARVVQGQSKNIEMATGGEAPEGSFYFSDTQEAYDELEFVMLRAKHMIKDFERDGALVPTRVIQILGVRMDTNKLFILNLSLASFSNFGRLIARFNDMGVVSVWQHLIKATSEKKENDKGKFWVQSFNIVRELNEKELQIMQDKYREFGAVLEKQEDIDLDEV